MRAAALVALGVALAGGCRRVSLAGPRDGGGATTAAGSDQAPRAGDAGVSGLPEDPDAGRKSEAQWRKHMDWEERERRLSFDKNRIPEHRAVIQRLAAARARYDRAKTKAAVERVRSEMPALAPGSAGARHRDRSLARELAAARRLRRRDGRARRAPTPMRGERRWPATRSRCAHCARAWISARRR